MLIGRHHMSVETHRCPFYQRQEKKLLWSKDVFYTLLRIAVLNLTTRNPSVVQFEYISGYMYYLRPNSLKSCTRNMNDQSYCSHRQRLFVHLLAYVFVLKDELCLMLFR